MASKELHKRPKKKCNKAFRWGNKRMSSAWGSIKWKNGFNIGKSLVNAESRTKIILQEKPICNQGERGKRGGKVLII